MFFPFLSFFLQLCINNEAFITIKGSFVGFSRFFYGFLLLLFLTLASSLINFRGRNKNKRNRNIMQSSIIILERVKIRWQKKVAIT